MIRRLLPVLKVDSGVDNNKSWKILIVVRLLVLLVAGPGTNHTLLAQDVIITQVDLQPGGDVVIHYDIEDDRIDRKFTLFLYSSADNYIQPLENVEGDVGVGIPVGGNKTITWHAKEELGETYQGAVALELKGNIYIPFIALDNFDDYKVLKRGKPYEVTWTGGRGDNVLLFELYEEDSKIKVFEERPNVGNTTIVIPKDVKPGHYRFKISDSRNRDEVVYTNPFVLRRQVPIALKIVAAGALFSGGYFGVSLLGGAEGQEKIPDPLSPPAK